MKKLLFVMGTRPEIIKVAPVVLEACKRPNTVAHILHTGQHKEMAEEMFRHFGLTPDYDLGVMKENQSLFELTARITQGIGEILKSQSYDMIFVQGDTSSAFLGALCGFYAKTPVAHIEAGLRTQTKYSPFPEEINRRLVTPIADLHFAPTAKAAEALKKDGVNPEAITISGNTVIDALLWSLEKQYPLAPEIKEFFGRAGRLILVTTHRRESFGEPHRQIFEALLELVRGHEDVRVLLPMHPNPNVRAQVQGILGGQERILLTEPLDYQTFIAAMRHSYLILTDSGGVQEEAPSLDKPVLILRESTERPEGIETGALKLVGTDREVIVREAKLLLNSDEAYQSMAQAANPYGDGAASQRIIDAALRFLGV
jgi:UDP-N-acetylglucosamine 2-epimerase (non-hydrolysing)